MPTCPTCGKRYPADVRFCGVDGAALEATEAVRTERFAGKIVGDGWCLRAELGHGAFGSVYAATHPTRPGEFAVKVLRSHQRASAEQTARFHREVHILAELRGPNLVEIVGFGHDDASGYYVVMPRLHGENLAQRLRRSGALPLPDVDALLRQMAAALTIVHAANVVHRDIKAENIFLESTVGGNARVGNFHARLLDFGLAKVVRGKDNLILAGDPLQTRPSQVLGSPANMAPEQVVSAEVDARTDLYSLGIVLFEALTGTLPFDADSAVMLMRMQVFDAPPPPSQRAPWVPPILDAVILDLLQKRPSQRLGSVAALLERWQGALPTARMAWQLSRRTGDETID